MSPKLRLLHITEYYPPDYGGGVSVYVQDICQFLAGRGHEVSVFCVENKSGDSYTLRTEWDGPVKVTRVNLPYFAGHDPEGWSLGLLKWRSHQQRLVSIINGFIEETKPDLIHCHLPRLLGEEFIIEIEKKDIPLVWMLHDSWPSCVQMQFIRSPLNEPCEGPSYLRCVHCIYSNNDGSHTQAVLKLPWRMIKLGLLPAYRIWRRSVARKCGQSVLAHSQSLADANLPFMKAQMEFIPLGINLTGLPKNLPVCPRKPLRFGFVAGFQGHKGVWHVLDAVAALKRRGLNCELHIWGRGQEKGRAEICARNLEDRVYLRGMYAPQDRWSVYTSVDIAIMATTGGEAFGRIIKEAAATGAPTIAPATGGITEQIRHGVDGLLYRFRDPLDLEQQMARVLEEPGLFETLSSNLLPVLDTRDAVADVEKFYFRALGMIPAAVGEREFINA